MLKKIIRRDISLFKDDIKNNQKGLLSEISNSRILIIGAAGSIGAAFVTQVVKYNPRRLHLVDISENNLVEVVRDLRSSNVPLPDDFATYTIGLESIEFSAFIKSHFDYDYVVNFSALKHVRSERDPYTLMRMLNTNVYALKDLLEYLNTKTIKKFFSVSSDKSVNPANIMGASKALMEKTMLSYSDKTPCSSARFANVAFSDGSLLYSFQRRVEKKQPISTPSDVKRYFISHEEAGQLCLLSCFLGGNRENYFPKLDEDLDMYTFAEIADIFIRDKGYNPIHFSSEEEARKMASEIDEHSKDWPIFITQSDTTGEKMFEEFYTEDDIIDLNRYQNIAVIKQKELDASEKNKLTNVFSMLADMRERGTWTKEEILKSVRIIIPEIAHSEKDKNLDQKM